MAILIMLILPIQEHGTCFSFFVSSLISFFSFVWFSEYRSFTSLLGLFLNTLFFLFLYQMGFFFLTSVSDISLLVYKNAFDFWILILYPAVLPNSFIGVSRFVVEFTGFSMYTTMSFANSDSFISSFPIWMPFISFFVWLLRLGLPILCWIRVVKQTSLSSSWT